MLVPSRRIVYASLAAAFLLLLTARAASAASVMVDFNGDRRADLFAINRQTGDWITMLSTGDGFFTVGTRGGWWPNWSIRAGDFNADNRTDFLLHDRPSGLWYLARADGAGGFTYASGGWRGGWTPYIADLNGDGRSDVMLYDDYNGHWTTAFTRPDASAFDYQPGQWAPGWQMFTLKVPYTRDPVNNPPYDPTEYLALYDPRIGANYLVYRLGSTDPLNPTFYSYAGQFPPNMELIPQTTSDQCPGPNCMQLSTILLYDRASGRAIHGVTGGPSVDGSGFCPCYGFTTYPAQTWPAGLEILGASGFRARHDANFLLYEPESGLVYIANTLNLRNIWSYYITTWAPHITTLVADFTGDGFDDVFLYDPESGVFSVAVNQQSTPVDLNWLGFRYIEGNLPPGMNLISPVGERGRGPKF